MEFKVIDGKCYKVEEMDDKELKAILTKSMKVIEDNQKKIVEIEKNRKNTEKQYDKQLSDCQVEIKNIEEKLAIAKAKLESIQLKKENAILPYQTNIDNCNSLIQNETKSLEDKKELISILFPEESKKVGF